MKLIDSIKNISESISANIVKDKVYHQLSFNLTQKYFYVIFSNKGYGDRSLLNKTEYFNSIFIPISYNVCGHMNKGNSFQYYDDITITFKISDLRNKRSQIINLEKSFSTIQKFNL